MERDFLDRVETKVQQFQTKFREFSPFHRNDFVAFEEEIAKVSKREVMPAFWTGDDTRNAILSTLIPGGTAILGAAVYVADKETTKWWEKLQKPSWVTPNRVKVWSALDIVAGLPVGYASYLCYKHGGGFDYNDTRFALAVYGLNMASVAACIPLVKKRNINCLSRNMWIVHGTALLAAITFYKIHKPAGYWMIPYAVWSGFYLFLINAIKKENEPTKNL